MADRTVTIGSGKTYASLATALSTEYAAYPNLTSDNGSGGAGRLIFDCYSMEETSTVTVPSFTTDASSYVVIQGAAADKTSANTGKWSTERYRIAPATNNDVLVVNPAYTRIIDLQLQSTQASASTYHCLYTSGSSIRVERTIFRHVASGGSTGVYRGFSMATGTGTHTFINCLFYDFEYAAESLGHAVFCNWSNVTLNVYNCTLWDCYRGIWMGSGTANVYNCGFQSTIANAGLTETTCSHSDPTFIDAGADNFHLAVADTVWKDQGTDESGVFTNDVDGQTRPTGAGTWDIGFDEYVSPGAGPGGIDSTVEL